MKNYPDVNDLEFFVALPSEKLPYLGKLIELRVSNDTDFSLAFLCDNPQITALVLSAQTSFTGADALTSLERLAILGPIQPNTNNIDIILDLTPLLDCQSLIELELKRLNVTADCLKIISKLSSLHELFLISILHELDLMQLSQCKQLTEIHLYGSNYLTLLPLRDIPSLRTVWLVAEQWDKLSIEERAMFGNVYNDDSGTGLICSIWSSYY